MPLFKATSSFQRLLESVKYYHGYRFYISPIPQTFWSPHPYHVSSSNSLWVDLAMVGVMYRLDEVYYDILICPSMVNDGVFWVPYAFYLAVFDSFEALILIQAEYQIRGGVSWLHNVVQLASWLFLALMGASIPNHFDCGSTLPRLVTMYFPIFKLCHSTVQIISYCDIVFLAKQSDALPRLLSSIAAVLPLITSVVLAVHGYYLVAYTMFFASFVVRYASFYIFYMLFKPKKVKTNMPFIIQRYRDWVQIQLGSVMLGLVTSMTLDESAAALVSASYAFLAVLDLLSYSSDPKTFSKHALVRFNSLPSHLWFLLFVGLGFSILGIAVGTRYLLKQEVPSTQATWILVVSTMCSMVCLLLQKMVHENHLELRGELKTKKQVLVAIILAIATCAIAAPFSQHAGMGPWIPFNLFLSTGLVLLLHAFNGGFQREISKRVHRTKLRGQILAVLIARAWLKRARQTIALREEQALRRSRRRTLEAITQMRLLSASPDQKRASEETLSPWAGESNDKDDDEVCMLDEAEEEEIRQIQMQVSWKLQSSELITSRRGNGTPGPGTTTTQNATAARVLKTLILNRFYLKATFLVPHDVFADYHVSWSDLFFDILFVAVVYRLGYFLINGLGLSHPHGNEPKVDSSMFFEAVFCFVSVYVAVFNLWFTKLNYSSKIKTSDVSHMVIDMILGYFVLFCALNIYSPRAMANDVSFQYWISGMLTGYHLTLLLLWIEAFTSLGKNSFLLKQSSHKCAIRNIKRQFLSLLALCIAFFTSGTGCPLVVTCFFWLCTYLFPLMQRIEDITQQPWINEAPFLLRFVLHRMADYSLLVLGEGVLQIIRAVSVTQSSPEVFLPFSLAFLCITCCRICCFQLDCLDASTASKHAVLQQQKAYNLAVSVVRLVWSGPAVVAFGVSLKLIVETEDDSVESPMIYHVCGISSTLAMLSFVTTYHLHRTAYFENKLAWKKLLMGIALSLLFLAFPWIPDLPKDWMLFTNAMVWLIGSVVLGYVDDFLQAEVTRGDNKPSRVSLPVLKTSEQTMIPVQQPKHSSRLERQKNMRSWSREVTRLQQSRSGGDGGALRDSEDGEGEELLQPQNSDLQVV